MTHDFLGDLFGQAPAPKPKTPTDQAWDLARKWAEHSADWNRVAAEYDRLGLGREGVTDCPDGCGGSPCLEVEFALREGR